MSYVCVKLSRTQRWMSAKKHLQNKHGVAVHFSSNHANYFTAWKYVTKEDVNFEQSDGHPDLTGPENCPRTMHAHRALKDKHQKRANEECYDNSDQEEGNACTSSSRYAQAVTKRKRLSAFEVSEIILSHYHRSYTEITLNIHACFIAVRDKITQTTRVIIKYFVN